MALNVFARKKGGPRALSAVAHAARPASSPDYQPADVEVPHPDPLQRLCQQHRYAVIIAESHRWEDHPNKGQWCAQAERALEEGVALVPQGSASLTTTLDDQPGAPETEVEVAPFLLSLHPVTNARFQHFVDDGCYDQLDLWPEEVWPHLIGLHDLTDKPGPRFWRDGRHDRRRAEHPVVGLSWYEASAYAKWVGLRLPTEAEWQMAASWRIKSEADVLRRFPWGDAMSYQRCNIWGTGLGHIAPVDAFAEGDAPNSVRQLIGNVWEWTATDFDVTDHHGRPVIAEMPMKSIRGAAFDTYFDNQATSVFRTGQILLARAHNVGFRCALDV